MEQDGLLVPRPPRLHLSSESVDSGGVYLLDCLDRLWLLVGSRAQPAYLQAVFGTAQLAAETVSGVWQGTAGGGDGEWCLARHSWRRRR